MKNLFAAAFLLISIAASCAESPKISFQEEIFDFGDVAQDQVLRHVFIFTNAGNATLTIEDVRAG